MGMFKKVKKIKNFGVFRDFEWSKDLPILERFNVIYGWNGTGKTTLSRIFRSIELGEIHNDYENSVFKVEGDNSSVNFDNENLRTPNNVRVFNVDFVEENIRWKETETNPILFVGKDNAELSKTIEKKTEKHEKLLKEIPSVEKKYSQETKKLDTLLQNEAKNIKSSLTTVDRRDKFVNYNKRSIDNSLKALEKTNKTPIRLDEEVLLSKNQIIQGHALDTLPEVKTLLPNFKKIVETLGAYGQEKVTAKVMEELKEDSVVSKWVENGLGIYHERKNENCYFCGAKVANERINTLEKHFSDEYEKFISNGDKYIELLKAKVISLEMPNEKAFYTELQKIYAEDEVNLSKEVSKLNASIQKCIDYVESKKLKPFDVLEFPDELTNISTFKTSEALEKVNSSIKKHNDKSKNFDKEIENAKLSLEEHYISIFYSQYLKSDRAKNKLQKDLGDLEDQEKALVGEISELKTKLSSAGLAVTEFNELLSKFLGRDNIRISLTDEEGFEFMRNDYPAKNLSEGEKTAIAFIYFIIKLKEEGFNKEEAIIVIDDPISSLDGNALFGAFAFMQEHVHNAKQVIILTHNFYFLKRVIKWFSKMGRSEVGKRGYYMLNAIMVEENRISEIVKMDNLLKNYHSEYHYLFKKLYDYSLTNNQDLEYYYGVPNMARKFMETFMDFKDPRDCEISNKFEKLNYDFAKKKRIIGFLHANSHSGQEGVETFDISLLNETPTIIKELFELLKAVDEKHFQGLMDLANPKEEGVEVA